MPDIPMTSKIARKPWSLFKLESAMTRLVSKTNARFELVPGLRNCCKKREERQGAGGRVRHRNERRGTRRARRREETVTEIKSVQFGAPRGGPERKRERDREREGVGGGEERPHNITALSSR